jgi:hypothetical protein
MGFDLGFGCVVVAAVGLVGVWGFWAGPGLVCGWAVASLLRRCCWGMELSSSFLFLQEQIKDNIISI